ncbi:MAG: 50S ribosomal protein L10 [Candidatus Izimaplasma sp.]|nr:50S ribosomal protein L10 [Candidatus Izimaplasma bacterium]
MSTKAIEKKKQEVAAVVERMKGAKSFVVLDYSGLTVEQITNLRVNLYENDCEMSVIKNNISKRAVEKAGFEDVLESLIGPNALVFSNEDSVSAAKVVYDFAKDNSALELKVGVVDGTYMDNDTIKQIATVPSRDQLLTMIAKGILEPIHEFAISVDLLAKDLDEESDSEEK